MATWDATWVGTTDTDYGTAGNWSPANVPTAGEDVHVPAATNAIAGSDQSAVDATSIWVDRSCTNAIGSSGNPLILASNLVVLEGTGEKYIKASGNGIDYVVVNMNDPSQRVTLHPNTTAKMTNVIAIQGNITIAGEAGVIALVHVMSPNVKLNVASGAGGITLLINAGAEIISRELITTLHNLPGGVVTQEYSSGDTIGTSYLAKGSTLNFDHAGTIALVIAEAAAILDLTRNGYNKTITTLIADKKAIIRKGANVAVTNGLYGAG